MHVNPTLPYPLCAQAPAPQLGGMVIRGQGNRGARTAQNCPLRGRTVDVSARAMSAQPGLANFGRFLPAAAHASCCSCSCELRWAAPRKAPSKRSPPQSSQAVHGRPPRQPPPIDRCCNGYSQRHHSGPSWPKEAIGTASQRPRSPPSPPFFYSFEFRTVHTSFLKNDLPAP